MRTAFQLSGDCSYDFEFNLPVEGLPVCSIPPFTTPTMVIHFPEVIGPDVDIPDLCHCIEFDVSNSVKVDGSEIGGGLVIVPQTDDCCDLAFDVDLDIDIPCMPFAISGTADMIVAGDSSEGYINLAIVKTPGECEFDIDLDIEIPCLPFAIRGSGDIAIGGLYINVDVTRGPDEPQEQFSCHDVLVTSTEITQVATPVTHTLPTHWTIFDFKVEPRLFELPPTCIPFDVYIPEYTIFECDCKLTQIPITWNVQSTCETKPGGWGTFWETQPLELLLSGNYISIEMVDVLTSVQVITPEEICSAVEIEGPPCEFDIGISIEIPCFPLTFGVGGTITETSDGPPEFDIQITRIVSDVSGTLAAEECAFSLGISIAIPCVPDIIPGIELAMTCIDEPSATAYMTSPTACELELMISMEIPMPKLSMNVSATVIQTCIEAPVLDFQFRQKDCSHEIEFKLELPTPPELNVEFNMTSDCGGKPEATMYLSFPSGACDEMALIMSMYLPEVPELGVQANVTSACLVEPQFTAYWTGGADCSMDLILSMQLPEFPALDAEVNLNMTCGADPTAGITLIEVGTCELLLLLSLVIPEPDFSVAITKTFTAPCLDPAIPAAFGAKFVSVGPCEKELEFSVVIPEFPDLGVNVNVTSECLAEPSFTGYWVTGDCELDLVLSMRLPEFPDLGVEVNVTSACLAEPGFAARWSKQESCAYDLIMSLQLPEFPELGVDVNITSACLADPSFTAYWTDNGSCAYDLNLSMMLPEFPDLGVNVNITSACLEEPGFTAYWEWGESCNLDLNLSMKLPEFPELGVDVNITSACLVEPSFTAYWAWGESCDLDLNLSMQLPEFPDLGVEVNITSPCGGEPGFTAYWEWGESCNLDLILSMILPEPKISMAINATAIQTCIDEPNIEFVFTRPGGSCDHALSLKLEIPTPPDLGIQVNITSECLAEPSFTGYWNKIESCPDEMELVLSMKLPEFPELGVAVNMTSECLAEPQFAARWSKQESCAYDLLLSMQLPEFPDLGVVVNVTSACMAEPGFAARWSKQESCAYDLILSMQLPEFPELGANVVIEESCGIVPSFTAHWDSVGTCAYDLNMSLKLAKMVSYDVLPPVITDECETPLGLKFSVVDNGDCGYGLALSMNIPLCDWITCGDINIAGAPVNIVMGDADATPEGEIDVTKLGSCDWQINLSLFLPAGGSGGGISCGELEAGYLLTKSSSCVIDHDCDGLYDSATDIGVIGPLPIGALPVAIADGVASFTIPIRVLEAECGHVQGWFSGGDYIGVEIDVCEAAQDCGFISCGDLVVVADDGVTPGGASPIGGDGDFYLNPYYGDDCTLHIEYYISFPPATDPFTCSDLDGCGIFSCGDLTAGEYISIGPDCEIGHDCAGLYDSATDIGVIGPLPIGALPVNVTDGVVSFTIPIRVLEADCGHVEGWYSGGDYIGVEIDLCAAIADCFSYAIISLCGGPLTVVKWPAGW
jgi:hypothetical protein